jgi:uncharacterized protein YlaI
MAERPPIRIARGLFGRRCSLCGGTVRDAVVAESRATTAPIEVVMCSGCAERIGTAAELLIDEVPTEDGATT